jgi:hypothetical protein
MTQLSLQFSGLLLLACKVTLVLQLLLVLHFAKRGPTWTRIMWMQPLGLSFGPQTLGIVTLGPLCM